MIYFLNKVCCYNYNYKENTIVVITYTVKICTIWPLQHYYKNSIIHFLLFTSI